MADENTNDTGATYTFYAVPGLSGDDANVYAQIPDWSSPPPVTNTDFDRLTTNTINTQLQAPIPPNPPTGAEVLNLSIPSPSAPPPVTAEQIYGGGIPLSSPPPPVTSVDFNANINNSTGGAAPNLSLNGDSNITGGIATGSNSSNPTSGTAPGTGTQANNVLSPGSNNPINNIIGKFGNGSTPFAQQQVTVFAQDYMKPTMPTANNPPVNQSDAQGRRVRLRPKQGGIGSVIGNSPLLSILKDTNGMIWPYQPLITYQQDVDYKSMELTHSNQDIYAYHRTPSLKLTVDGEFSVQNQAEGQYAMACIHFLRTVTKMHFGESDVKKGTPPPVLLFDAYGTYMFNSLPVIVNSFLIGLPKDVDYVPIDMGNKTLPSTAVGSWEDLSRNYLSARSNGNIIWLPAVFNIQVNLIVQNSPTKLRSFNLNQFRNGSLLKQGGWV